MTYFKHCNTDSLYFFLERLVAELEELRLECSVGEEDELRGTERRLITARQLSLRCVCGGGEEE